MSYRYYVGYRPTRSYNVPFVHLVRPTAFVGEAIYVALDGAVNFAARAVRAVQSKLRENAAVKELSALDDRILQDIGVPRSEIRTIARRVAENPGMDYRMLSQ